MCSVLLRYALTDELLSSTSLPADPRQASLLGCSDLHGNGSQIPFRKLAVRFESLLLSFYWEHRLLKLLLLFGVYFYYNKIHSHCRAGIIVKHIQTSVCFRCSSVVIKTSNISLGLRPLSNLSWCTKQVEECTRLCPDRICHLSKERPQVPQGLALLMHNFPIGIFREFTIIAEGWAPKRITPQFVDPRVGL